MNVFNGSRFIKSDGTRRNEYGIAGCSAPKFSYHYLSAVTGKTLGNFAIITDDQRDRPVRQGDGFAREVSCDPYHVNPNVKAQMSKEGILSVLSLIGPYPPFGIWILAFDILVETIMKEKEYAI